MSEQMNVDHEKVMALFGNVFNDVAGAVAIMMSILVIRLGYIKQWISLVLQKLRLLPKKLK